MTNKKDKGRSMEKRFPVNLEIKLSDEFGGNVLAERATSQGLYSVMQGRDYISSDVPYAKLEQIKEYASTDPARAQGALELLAYRR